MTTRSNSPAYDGDHHISENPLFSLKTDNGFNLDHLCQDGFRPQMPKELADPTPEYLDRHAYLAQLKKDLSNLHLLPAGLFNHLQKVLDREIQRVTEEIRRQEVGSPLPPQSYHHSRDEKITLTQIIMVPVDNYPKYNFVGRILGPRGMTVGQLEEDTGCKITVRGRGSCKVGVRHDRGTDDEPLHVLVQCEDYADVAHDKMDKALKIVTDLLTPPPDGKDELKRKQLIELSIINGTYRPTAGTKVALQTPSTLSAYQMASCTKTNNINCGGRGDLANSTMEHLLLAGLLGQQNNVHPVVAAEFVKTLLALSINQQPQPFVDMGAYPQSSSSSTQSGFIPPANLHQYLEATSMINAVPSFTHDGSGDAPMYAHIT